MKFKVWIKKIEYVLKPVVYSLASTSLMRMDCKAKEVLYWTLSAIFKEPCGISGPWTLKNCLVCSGEPVKYEKKWHGAELEGIRRSSCISTDTECPEEQQTDKQASNQKRWNDSTSSHLLLSLNRVKVERLHFSLHPPHITQGLILFWRETYSPALRFPPFLYLQSDCCRTLPVRTETIGESL